MYGVADHPLTRHFGRNEVDYTFFIKYTSYVYLYLFILRHLTQYYDEILQYKTGVIEILD